MRYLLVTPFVWVRGGRGHPVAGFNPTSLKAWDKETWTLHNQEGYARRGSPQGHTPPLLA